MFRYIATGWYRYTVLRYLLPLYIWSTRWSFMIFQPDKIVYSVLLSRGFTSSSATRRLLQKDRTQATSHRPAYFVARRRHFKSIKVASNFMHIWPLCYRFDQVATETSKQTQTDSNTMSVTVMCVQMHLSVSKTCSKPSQMLRWKVGISFNWHHQNERITWFEAAAAVWARSGALSMLTIKSV